MNITQAKQAVLEGHLIQYPNIEKLCEQNKLEVYNSWDDYSKHVNKYSLPYFRNIIKTVEEIYSGYWDFQYEVFWKSCDIKEERETVEDFIQLVSIKGVDIMFPSITISNNRGRKHNMTDLMVKLDLSVTGDNRVKIRDIQGCRFSATPDEIVSRYSHSHLSRHQYTSFPYFQSFCLGSGEINIFMSEINAASDLEEFTRLCYSFMIQLITLVSHESLAGGPYIEMSSIISREAQHITPLREEQLENFVISSIASSFFRNITDIFKRELAKLEKPNLTYDSLTNKFVIVMSPLLSQQMDDIVNSHLKQHSNFCNNFLFLKNHEGYYSYSRVFNSSSSNGFNPNNVDTSSSYLFRGEKMRFKINDFKEDTDENILNKDNYSVPMYIKQLIINKLQDEFNEKIFRNLALQRR